MVRQIVALLFNNVLERTWKDEVEAQFKILSQRLAEGNQKIYILRKKKQNC